MLSNVAFVLCALSHYRIFAAHKLTSIIFIVVGEVVARLTIIAAVGNKILVVLYTLGVEFVSVTMIYLSLVIDCFGKSALGVVAPLAGVFIFTVGTSFFVGYCFLIVD
jgi:hypothetical protein